jgi:hypothetical protein
MLSSGLQCMDQSHVHRQKGHRSDWLLDVATALVREQQGPGDPLLQGGF